MYHKILLAYDGSAQAAAALRQSADLAGLCNAELHLLGIVATSGSAALGAAYGSADFFGMELKFFEEALQTAIDNLSELVSVQTRIREGDPAEQIAAHAHEVGADLAVIGHSDKGLLVRWFEGSTGANLLRALPCSLLIATEK